MGKMKELLQSGIGVTRRTFMQGAAAIGSIAALAGCSKGDTQDIIYGGGSSAGLDNAVPAEDLSNPDIYYSSCVHNCGAGVRCVSKFHVVNGRIVRVTSDDSDFAFDGSVRNKEQYNDSRSLTCPKGRAFKFRVYQSGRLKYALKQTKQRGDMSGFKRIPLDQAMNEISRKYRAIVSKYGAAAAVNLYGSSGGYAGMGTYANYGGTRSALQSPFGARGNFSDYSYHQYHFGQPLTGHPGPQGAYTKSSNVAWQYPAIAGVVKNVVSWGSNILSTNNSAAWGYIRSFEKLKERGGKAYFVGPELTDTGVTCHTDWVQLRNYTDTALIMAMMYEMLVNTFNADGTVKSDAWLDVNYLDTMVYGFFDSPEYWVMTTATASNAGEISLTPQTGAGWRKVEGVPAGRSLASYILGNSALMDNATYDKFNNNYTAAQFGTMKRADKCSWEVNGQPAHSANLAASKYLYKQQMMTPKSPEWAEKICGTPAETIRKLAKMYCDPAQHPIFNEWCGGVQKQENGVVNIFAIQALMCVTKTFGLSGETLSGPWAATMSHGPVADSNAKNFISIGSLGGGTSSGLTDLRANISISCKEWFNSIKLAFAEQLTANGYTGKHIPDWDKTTRYYYDDGGVKSGVLYEREPNGDISVDANGYYKVKQDANGNPIYVGARMIISSAGGILLNQHMNTNDTTEMYKALPIAGANPDDADTLCLVQIDLFMSPSARYADYVLPGVSNLEAVETASIGGQTAICRPGFVKPVGDSVDSWRMTYEAYKAQSGLGEFTDDLGRSTSTLVGSHLKYVGTASTSKTFKPVEEYLAAKVNLAIGDPTSKFYGMTLKEVYANQFTPAKNNEEYIVTSMYETRGTATVPASNNQIVLPARDTLSTAGLIRKNLDDYIKLSDAVRKTTPFVFTKFGDNTTVNTYVAGTYSNAGRSNILDITNKPNPAGRFQVYNGMMVFDYENNYSKCHGWLPAEKRGQSNKDYENNARVYPIPMYFNFEDCFNEMFGVFNGKPENDLSKKNGLTLGTTHDRFRVHSTHNENPFLRELNHRTKGGKWASANDWNEYCVVPDRQAEGSDTTFSKMISTAVENKNMKTASWHEIWINKADAAERGIMDGDLVRVENPIGAIRVIARVTDRCVKGHLNLHQGGWYDPNPADGVDDGGCANTLIASKPSRIDHGNSQQMCYVTIRKETSF